MTESVVGGTPQSTDPCNDAGTYVTTGGLWSDVFTYDTRSNLISHVDARGVETNFNYNNDPLNRLQSISWDTSGFGDTLNPILPAPTISYTYMTAGDRTRVDKVTTTGVSTKDFSYDTEGRVSSVSMTLTTRAAFPQVTDYTYDSLNRVTDMRYPAEYGNGTQPRKLVHQDFDVASRLSGLKLDGVSQASSIVYNPASQATSLKVGTGANQITESYAYEALTGLLSNQKVQRGTTTLLDLSYDYLRAGTTAGRTGQLTDIGNNLDHGRDRAYEYDALGRLKKATGGSTPSWTQTYGYDRYGNRTTVTATGTADDGSAIPRDGFAALAFGVTTNRITTAGWQYDAAGNQVRGLVPGSITTWQKYQYDAAGRLVNVKTDAGALIASYTYGDSNERLITNEGGYRTYYCSAGGTVIAEYSETPALPTTPKWSKSYLYLGGRLLSTLTPNGSGGEATEYEHSDRLGTRLITNPTTGGSFERVTLPFGTALNAESSGATNTRFTSYDRSATTKLDYAVNRHYDPQQGRFTQGDPIGMGAANLGDPQSLNSYSYTQNDPVNFTDPSGLMPCIEHIDPATGTLVCVGGSSWTVTVTGGGPSPIDDPGTYTFIINSNFRPFTGGGRTGSGNPQNPVPQGNSSIFDEAYRDCLSKLGNAPAPGVVQAAHVIQISQTTGVDPTLFSVTWHEESKFRYFPENGPHGDGSADIGPGQLHAGTWNKAPYTSGLRNPFGTNRAVGQVFNGDPIENLLLAAYALDSRAGGRAKKAGLYKAGQVGGEGYQTRVNKFNKYAKGYDDFFNCLAGRGFKAP